MLGLISSWLLSEPLFWRRGRFGFLWMMKISVYNLLQIWSVKEMKERSKGERLSVVPLLTAFRGKDSTEIGGTGREDVGGWEGIISKISSSTNHSVIPRNIQVGLSSGGSFSGLQLTPRVFQGVKTSRNGNFTKSHPQLPGKARSCASGVTGFVDQKLLCPSLFPPFPPWFKGDLDDGTWMRSQHIRVMVKFQKLQEFDQEETGTT